MCGLLWLRQKNKKPATKKLRKMYRNQQTRGQDGFGFVEINGANVGALKRFQTEDEFMHALYPSKASEIFAHHRIPTSTPNIPESNHPIPVSNKKLKYDYYVIHNGVISNTTELRRKFTEMGFTFTTSVESVYRTSSGAIFEDDGKVQTNDSEYLAIDLALSIEDKRKWTDSEGSVAFIVLQMEKGFKKAVKLFYGHNYRSPLKLHDTDWLTCLSSAGEGKDVPVNTLFSIDYATNETENLGVFNIGSYARQTTPVVSTPVTHGGYNKGMVWDEKRKIFVTPKNFYKEYGEDYWERFHSQKEAEEEDDYGFSIPRVSVTNTASSATPATDGLNLPVLQILDVDDPDNEENYGVFRVGTKIKGYEETGICLNLSEGCRVYFTLDEVEGDWVELNERIAYWEDFIRLGVKETEAVQEAQELLDLLKEDQKVFETDLLKFYPDAFQSLKIETSEPLI